MNAAIKCGLNSICAGIRVLVICSIIHTRSRSSNARIFSDGSTRTFHSTANTLPRGSIGRGFRVTNGWFPRTNSEDAELDLDVIVEEFCLGDPEVCFDAYNFIAKTRLSYLLGFYAGELPGYDTHIWNEEEKWVIEIPVVNADQDFSVNFGYSDSRSWKQINDSHFQKIRSTPKAQK